MMIKCEGHSDAQLSHHDLACAISEAPAFVVKLLKCFPGKPDVCGSDFMYLREAAAKQSSAQKKCTLSFAAHS